MMRRRYELSQRDGGGYVARRCILDASERLGCAVRLEVDTDTPKGALLVLVGELLRAVAADGRERRNERQ